MVITIISKKGEIVFQANTETDSFETERLKLEQFLQSGLERVELVMEDSITIDDYDNAINNADGDGVIKEQKLYLK